MKKQNLCIAHPTNLNYSETFIVNQIKGLNVDFIIKKGRMPYLDKNNNTIFIQTVLKNDFIRGVTKNLFFKKYYQLYKKSLIEYLQKNNITSVLAEYGHVGVHVMEACHEAGVKLVVHFHGFDASDYKTLRTYEKQYVRFNDYCHKVIVVSEPMREKLIEIGIKPKKIEKISYGVDTSMFLQAKLNPETKNFVFVGRFTPKKAPLNTIAAFEKVYKQDNDVRLILVGDGELFNEAKKMVEGRNLTSVIDFKGALPPSEVQKEMLKANCYVQHSILSKSGDSEGFPNSILEAIASGLPVVSTYHAGIPEMVFPGKNGFLCEENDVDAMAKYMLQIIQNYDLQVKMGEYGRNFALNNYTLNGQIEKLRKVCSV